MNETETRPRRSLVVVLLDGVLRLFAALQAGPTPKPKVKEAGGRRGVGRWALLTGVLAALAGTALLVVVLVRAPGDPTPPPDPAAALPGLRSRPAGPSAAGSATSATSAPASPSSTSASSTAATAGQSAPATSVTSSIALPGAPIITENTSVPLTASYKTASATAGLLGYQMTVTVANPGAAPKNGWTLSVTLPRPTLLVSGVKGATAKQNGSVWTFTPDSTTSTVAAGKSVQVVFGVHGATLIDAAPQDCRIDGNPCSR
ncbi:cellulose binding domain-containing protein [Actinoplanes sp. NPDC051343]|uniref:cellulose binding domain-containing protein n=1 Tax=Actinoplanes sp. NPDC051343 TaxID=3363906 RepID=UPI00379AB98E